MAKYIPLWFGKEEFGTALESILSDNQVIENSLLNGDYDTVRERVEHLENYVKRARATMQRYWELGSPAREKFLEESLRKAKESLDRCPRQPAWITNKIIEEESEQERRERRERMRRWESIRQYRDREWLQQQPWFSQ